MNQFLVTAHAFVCALIALRVFLYRRRGANYRPVVSTVAWLILCAAAAVPIRAAFGLPMTVTPAELILSTVLCLALCAVRGNVAKLLPGAARLTRRAPECP